jgi:DNA modification methylase
MKTSRSFAPTPAPHLSNKLSALEQRLGLIEYRPPDRLTVYANNPRRHPEKQIIKLMASISEFGFMVPVLVDSDGVIMTGEARIEAARRLGMEVVPVIIADHLTKAQVKAYRLADNRIAELATWDEKVLAIEFAEILEMDELAIDVLGWETAQIDNILFGIPTETGVQSDPADEIGKPPAMPVTEIGDLWQLGKHRLLCGSSLDEVAWKLLMRGKTAKMAFVDPPYNVPVSGHVCGLGKVQHAEFAMASGEMSRAEFTAFLAVFLKNLTANIGDGGIIDICIDWRHLGELLAAIEETGLSLINMCVWNKSNGGMGSLYRSKHELVLIAKKGSAPHINNVELGKHGRYRTNVWDYAGINSFGVNRMTDLADHPTVKPLAMVADAIRDVTRPGDIVLDAFVGSGTTLLAAERTHRIGYAIEIDPGYVDVAVARWEKMSGKAAILDGTGERFADVAARRAQAAEAA